MVIWSFGHFQFEYGNPEQQGMFRAALAAAGAHEAAPLGATQALLHT